MRTVFLDALKKLCAMPPIRHVPDLALDFFLDVPGIQALGLRLMRVAGPDFTDHFFVKNLSPEGFRASLNQEPFLATVPDDPFQLPSLIGGTRPGEIFFAPVRKGSAILGELYLLADPVNERARISWMQFCEQAAVILSDKIRDLFHTIDTRGAPDATSLLDTLIELHQEPEEPGNRSISIDREKMVVRWAEEDYQYLHRFLTIFQKTFDLETVFVVHRIAFESVQIVISGPFDTPAEVDEATRDMIEVVTLKAFDLPYAGCLQRVFRTDCRQPGSYAGPRCPQLHSSRIGDQEYAYFGVDIPIGRTNPQAWKMISLLANHLGFRFAHLCQQRKEEIHRRMLQQINNVCNIITSNVNEDGILDQLVANLETLFGQKSGAIYLVNPLEEDPAKKLSCKRQFGPLPPGFCPHTVLKDPRHLINYHIMGGSAFGILPDQIDPVIRFIVSFNPMPAQSLSSDLPFQHQSIGGLVLFNLPDNRPLFSDLVEFLTILLNGVTASLLVASNYKEKLDTIRSLEGLIQKLSNKDELLDEMIEIVRKLLKVNRCSFLTFDPTRKFLVIEKHLGLSPEVVKATRIPLGKEISGLVAQTGISLRIDDIEIDERLMKRSQETYFNRSLLSVPLVVTSDNGEQQVLGVINVNNKVTGLTFTEQDQQLLETIAELVVVALENSRRLEARHVQAVTQAKLDAELKSAREVQTGLLPQRFDGLPNSLDAFGRSIPAREVGGDFFEGLRLKDGRWLFAIGDVSGKGMPAALLMATTRTILRSVALEHPEVEDILKRVNDLLSRDLEIISRERDECSFVTLALVILNPDTGDGEIASAGHGPLLIRRQSRVESLEIKTGKPLGLNFFDEAYPKDAFHLAPGESLLFFTDGLFEERNPDGEMLGMPKVEALFGRSGSEPAKTTVDGVIDLAKDWRGQKEAHDDLTILAVTYRGKSS